MDGSLSGPAAAISTSAVQVPREVSTRQRRRASSQAAARTSWPSRRRGRMP
jgi:hypothetical protein